MGRTTDEITEHVWVARKPGSERRYTSPIPWSAEFLEVLRSNGYQVVRVGYVVKDSADLAVAASCAETEVPLGANPEE